MSKYIDADKLKNELESIYDNMLKRIKIDKDNSDYWGGKADAYRNVIDTITSRQQEQPEVDLEKEFALEYAIYHLPTFILASLVDGTELIDFIHKTARHFYELGRLNTRKEE